MPPLPPPSIIPGKKRVRRQRRPSAAVAVAPLTLVAASFDPDGPEVYLTFDRAIAIAGLVVGQFAIVDGPDGNQFIGFETPELVSPTEVLVRMMFTGSVSGPDVLLTVGAGNGILAAGDGGTWGGASGTVLPFP